MKKGPIRQDSVNRREFMERAFTGSGAFIMSSDRLFTQGDKTTNRGNTYRNYKHVNSRDIVMANQKVEIVFGHRSGSIRRIANKILGKNIEIPESAAAPAQIWVGTNDHIQEWVGVSAEQPDESIAVLSQLRQKLDSHKQFNYPTGIGLKFYWKNITDNDGKKTGVSIRQHYTLDKDTEFLRVRTHVINGGDRLVTGLAFGLRGVQLGGNASKEVLTAPTGGMGKKWIYPKQLLGKKSLIFCVPPTVPQGLVSSWIDISNPELGLGIGYLNHRGMDMIGEAAYTDEGISLSWRMFRLDGGWKFMSGKKIGSPHQVYPLRPGEEFSTDDWFLGYHTGDWHDTAVFYRKEYERVFHSEFLPWEEVSPTARNADLILDVTAAWGVRDSKGYVAGKGVVKNHFAEVPDKVQTAITEVGAKPSHVLMVMLGQATHWGIYKLPDYFPVNRKAGGQLAFKEMICRLRQEIGIGGTHFYTHLVFNHPEAANYVPEADTGWNENLYSDYGAMGRVACLDCGPWLDLWKNKLIPEFVESGASGIEVDEGFGHHLICFRRDHLHGTSAESILTAQCRGALRIYRKCRSAFGEGGYLECEGGSDVYARLVDLWEAGGKGPFEVVRYTHPDKLIALFVTDAESVCLAFVYGMVILSNLPISEELRDPLKRYVALRQELREKNAPGYPYGFRDDRGLSVLGTGVLARAFSNHRGITITYYAKEAVTAEVFVDGRTLGHPRMSMRRHKLTLPANHFGYLVLD